MIIMKNNSIFQKIIRIIIVVLLGALLVFGILSIMNTVAYKQNIIVSAKRMTELKPYNIEITRDFSSIQSKNPDNIGWVTIDATVIDFPLMQGKDNFEYLKKDAFGNKSELGSAYLDCFCAKDFSLNYNVIHGHNSRLGVFFDDLCKFEDEDYFCSHKSGTIVTSTETYRLEIFACVHANRTDAYIYGFLPVIENCNNSNKLGSKESAAKLRSILYDYVLENAVQKRNVTLDEKTKVVAFSTCAKTNEEERTVVFAKII